MPIPPNMSQQNLGFFYPGAAGTHQERKVNGGWEMGGFFNGTHVRGRSNLMQTYGRFQGFPHQ